jgi:hypothetical protein
LNEKEIRDRIEGFLKRTARTVVVPASMGLGFSGGACDGTAMHARVGDAAADLSTQPSDALVISSDAADLGRDLPEMLLPYLVVMVDARVESQPVDSESDSDVSSDAQPDAQPDALPDIGTPLPPYMAPDAGRDLPVVVPPYLAPFIVVPASPGGTAPVPPTPSRAK